MFIMRLFTICFFILWLNVDKSLQQAAKQCGHPGDAQFADFQLVEGDDFVFGSKVVYTCHIGYEMMSRRNLRTCGEDGWDGIVPVCEASQCPPIIVDQGIQVFGDTEEATFGKVVRFSCRLNREMLEGPDEVYCDETGKWSSNPPICTAVKCQIPVIDNGFVTDTTVTDYYQDDVLHFECNVKYQPSEGRQPRCIKIGQRAEWSPTPACEPAIKCKLLLPPVDGSSYRPEYTNLFLPGQTVTVICGDKYGITDNQAKTAQIRCKDNGQWETEPVCKVVSCYMEAPYVYYWYSSRRRVVMDQSVGYVCQRHYEKPPGVTEATCTRNGWTPNPLCEEIPCLPPQLPNANLTNYKQQYKDEEKAHYVCKGGFKRTFSLTCTKNGWTGCINCEGITCLRRTDPNAAILNRKATYSYNEQIDYVCKMGRGRYSLTCGQDGWVGFRSGSKPADCEIPPPLLDGDVKHTVESQYKHCEEVEYSCQTYYVMEGEPYRTCVDGVWSGHMRCLKPCIINEETLRQHNITLLSDDKKYYIHDEKMVFGCVRGQPAGTVAMSQRCSSGEFFTPSCS